MKTGWNGLGKKALVAGALLTVSTVGVAIAGWTQHDSNEKAMMTGKNGWSIDAKFTVGEMINGYRPIGILDGIGAYRHGRRVRVLVNHEVGANLGYAFPLANGTYMTGSRVSYVDFDRYTRKICDAGPAFDTVYDRHGKIVTDPKQVNETGNRIDGISRLCSSQLVTRRDRYGFRDTIYFTGEETGKPFHPHGGTEWALDVKNDTLWACPDLGRGAWENVTPIATGQRNKIALLLGDDSQSAPLYLYVGTTNPRSRDFLERNGLKGGKLYAWKADNGDLDPDDWNGTGTGRDGTFVEVTVKDASKANTSGYDSQGYADIDTLQNQADSLGCFSFSRPEDLATNPDAKNQAVFASTGRGGLFPSDDWGTVYIVIVKFQSDGSIDGRLEIIYDGDDAGNEDNGLRSPDNLDWADDGYIYVNEDRSTSIGTFGGTLARTRIGSAPGRATARRTSPACRTVTSGPTSSPSRCPRRPPPGSSTSTATAT